MRCIWEVEEVRCRETRVNVACVGNKGMREEELRAE